MISYITKEKTMTNLTTNQKQAMNVFQISILDCSDFEWGDYVFLPELIELLIEQGWDAKSAEGTVGSLTQTSFLNLYEESDVTNEFQETWILENSEAE
tara:strand:+ start:302 stop:595 length:294 start_codon:yes stop_codon:yes gene_type:complete